MRRLRNALLALALLGASLFALCGWLLFSDSGTRSAARMLQSFSAGSLQLEGVRGQLGRSLQIGRIEIRMPERSVSIDDFELVWQPAALWQRTLHVERIGARSLRLLSQGESADTATPAARPPASLRLPLALHVDHWHLDALHTSTTQAVLHSLRGSLHADGKTPHRLAFQLGSAWATAQGQLEVQPDAPFHIASEMRVQRDDAPASQARINLDGPLADLLLQAHAQALDASLLLQGRITPFAALPLQAMVLRVHGLDPRSLSPGAPEASLHLEALLSQTGSDSIEARFQLDNRRPTTLDRGGLPLRSLRGILTATPDTAWLRELQVNLGSAGILGGEARRDADKLLLTLSGPTLNLAGLHRQLTRTRIDTRLQLEATPAKQQLTLQLRDALGNADLHLSHADARITLHRLDVNGRVGTLQGKGELALSEPRTFGAELALQRLNPAALGNFPRASINARLQAEGQLGSSPILRASLQLPGGEFEGRPVQGEARLHYAESRLIDAQARLDLAGNHLNLAGSYGRTTDELHWTLDAPALDRVLPGFSGLLISEGHNRGLIGKGQLHAKARAQQLALPGDIRIGRLTLDMALDNATQGEFRGQLEASALQRGELQLAKLSAQLEGQPSAHRLQLSASQPGTQGSQLALALAGGLDPARQWQGELRELRVDGPWPARLQTPARLRLSETEQTAENLQLQLLGGELQLQQLHHRGGRIRSEGRLQALALAPLLNTLDATLPLSTDMSLSGNWALDVDLPAKRLLGDLEIRRHSGDIRLRSPAQALQLQTLSLRLGGTPEQLQADFALTSALGARLNASASFPFTAGLDTLSQDSPLRWQLDASLPDLQVLRPWLPSGLYLDAALQTSLRGSGSLRQPDAEGHLDLQAIRFRYPQEGIVITDGELRLALDAEQLRVTQGELRGQDGRILISGGMALQAYRSDLALRFERFAATRRADREIQLSGDTRLQFDGQGLALTGALKVDRARLEIPEASRPALLDDVIIVRSEQPTTRPADKALPLRLDLRLDLGERTYFKGAGLDARLGGALRIFSEPRGIRGEGAILVAEGRYSAYATTLAIRRGILRFIGPLDNPALDILAVREFSELTVGVLVAGTVSRPLVSLYSDPSLPDTEKLSWLILGHGLDGGGQQEFALMQLAASGLLGQAESVNLQASLAEMLGIDSISLRAGDGEDLSTAVGSVGKRLSDRATLSYEQSLDGLNQAVKLVYQLTRRIRLEAQAGERSSFDAIYTIDYD